MVPGSNPTGGTPSSLWRFMVAAARCLCLAARCLRRNSASSTETLRGRPLQYLQIHTLSSYERLSFPRPALVSATARTLSRISKGRVGSRCHPHRKIYIFQDCVLCNMLCDNHSDITCYITHNPVLGNIYYILGYINILILYNLLYRKNPVSCKIWYITC